MQVTNGNFVDLRARANDLRFQSSDTRTCSRTTLKLTLQCLSSLSSVRRSDTNCNEMHNCCSEAKILN